MIVRDAVLDDLPAVVALYADDDLGRGREDPSLPLAPGYLRAFAEIVTDPRHRLLVAVEDDEVVGTLLLSFLPGLSRHGAERAQLEAVRVARDLRGRGTGEVLVRWSVERARERGCSLVQLTSDASRADAHRFWSRLGFAPSHLGFKLPL